MLSLSHAISLFITISLLQTLLHIQRGMGVVKLTLFIQYGSNSKNTNPTSYSHILCTYTYVATIQVPSIGVRMIVNYKLERKGNTNKKRQGNTKIVENILYILFLSFNFLFLVVLVKISLLFLEQIFFCFSFVFYFPSTIKYVVWHPVVCAVVILQSV